MAHLPKETVISVEGAVRLRPDGTVNPDLATGDSRDSMSRRMRNSARCASLPMNVFPEDHTPEETRLKYRFLDLRRSKLHQTVMLRSQIISSIRRKMIELGFQEFQTPILTRPIRRAVSRNWFCRARKNLSKTIASAPRIGRAVRRRASLKSSKFLKPI